MKIIKYPEEDAMITKRDERVKGKGKEEKG